MSVTDKNKSFVWFSCADVLMLVYCGLGALCVKSFWQSFFFEFFLTWTHDLLALGLIFFLLSFVNIFFAVRLWMGGQDKELFGSCWWEMMKRHYLTRQRIYDIVHFFLLFKVMLIVYCQIKQTIPFLNPIVFDQQLLALDLFIHFGQNPMLVSKAFFSGWADSFIDLTYVAWYPVVGTVFILLLMQSERRVTEWGISALFLLWMIGGGIAVMIPSLGPVYVHPEWFSDLEIPHARSIQSQLWYCYEQVLENPDHVQAFQYDGVAAFPSLHVAVVALYTFVLFHINRWAGIVMASYTLLVQIGSVFLGWHYAIDGYFGILLAFILARLTRRFFLGM